MCILLTSSFGKENGFTLVELMVTLAILSITIAMGAFAITNNLKQMEARNLSSTLVSFLNNAKQDAIIYQNPIIVCTANSSGTCVQSGGNQLLSFIDKNNNNAYDAATDKLNNQLKLGLTWGAIKLNMALNHSYIIFKPENARPIGYMGNFQYCPTNLNDTNNRFKISFNITGIIKYRPYSVAAFNCP